MDLEVGGQGCATCEIAERFAPEPGVEHRLSFRIASCLVKELAE
eukprot:SAG11_NODE_2327_length_3516_cov_2.408838_4_plen_44_part_00